MTGTFFEPNPPPSKVAAWSSDGYAGCARRSGSHRDENQRYRRHRNVIVVINQSATMLLARMCFSTKSGPGRCSARRQFQRECNRQVASKLRIGTLLESFDLVPEGFRRSGDRTISGQGANPSRGACGKDKLLVQQALLGAIVDRASLALVFHLRAVPEAADSTALRPEPRLTILAEKWAMATVKETPGFERVRLERLGPPRPARGAEQARRISDV